MMNETCGNYTAENLSTDLLRRFYIAIELIIAILAIVGNSLVCVVISQNRRFNTMTNYFLVSLAIADILVGLVAIPCAVLTDLGRPHNDLPLCLLMLCILIVLTQSSILSLLAVAVERYIAILLPFLYQRIMSPRRAQLAVLITWVLAAICGSVPLMTSEGQAGNIGYCVFTCVVDMAYMVYFNFFCCFLLSLIAMLFIYGHIFLTIHHQLRRTAVTRGTIMNMTPTGGGNTAKENECLASEITGREAAMATARGSGNGPSINTKTTAVFMATSYSPANPRPGVPIKSNTQTFQELRKANSLFLLLFLFVLCWMPIHLINCVLLFCKHCHVPTPVTLTAILLSHANSALNPILYVYSMKSFRQTLMKMCQRKWKKQPAPQ